MTQSKQINLDYYESNYIASKFIITKTLQEQSLGGIVDKDAAGKCNTSLGFAHDNPGIQFAG